MRARRCTAFVVRGSAVLAAATALATSAAGGQPTPVDLPGLLARVGQRVEAYYARAQSMICLERVRIQNLPRSNSSMDIGSVRELVYELRVSWEPAGDAGSLPKANVLRELRTVNGRTPKPNDEPKCLDPEAVSLEPISFLLAHQQPEYKFSYKGSSRLNGRDAITLEYVVAQPSAPEVTWKDTCFSLSLPSRVKGRVWIDVATGDVLRLDESMSGPYAVRVPEPQRREGAVDSMTFELAMSSIRFKPFAFQDPDEIVMLPESFDSMSMAAGAGRLLISRSFSGYKRFVTGGRLLP